MRFRTVRGVRCGINLGNALDALPSSRRRLPIIVDHLDVIREAGFDTVRLPVAWSQHASVHAPFDISPLFFGAVDTMIQGALDRDLSVVVNVHHYDEMSVDPAAHHGRFLALWTQVAERYDTVPTGAEVRTAQRAAPLADRPAMERPGRRSAGVVRAATHAT